MKGHKVYCLLQDVVEIECPRCKGSLLFRPEIHFHGKRRQV